MVLNGNSLNIKVSQQSDQIQKRVTEGSFRTSISKKFQVTTPPSAQDDLYIHEP